MEVSETKLVNFAEKTKFDITADVAPPADPPKAVGLYGQTLVVMKQDGFEVLLPDIATLVKPDGTWNGQEPVFQILYKGKVYSSVDDIPGLNEDARQQRRGELSQISARWRTHLENLKASSTETIGVFSLDPNQLLTVTSGYKMVLSRPLDG